MTWILADRVKETSTTTGTGDITLAGAVTQFRAFSAVCADLDEVPYVIVGQSGTEWEVGEGVWHTGNTLTRTRVKASSNAGALVNFSAGTKDVFIDFVGDLTLGHPRRNVQTEDRYVPPETSMVVAESYEVASGKELELAAGAVMEVT